MFQFLITGVILFHERASPDPWAVGSEIDASVVDVRCITFTLEVFVSNSTAIDNMNSNRLHPVTGSQSTALAHLVAMETTHKVYTRNT